MFQSYLFPISYAFMTFPLAALLFTLPFMIVQYRRHGYIHKVRALMLYLLLLYLMNAFYLVLLPLPASRHNLAPTGNSIQSIPFQFIQDIMQSFRAGSADAPKSYWSVLSEPAFLQVLFNVLLTVPFGMFLNYYFRTRWVVCLMLSFSLSLFFEVTQITGIYGFYDHPYRVFDVDDLMANTLGGILGFRAASWISGLLPKIEQLDAEANLVDKRVTFLRRSIAFMMDLCVVFLFYLALRFLYVPGAYWIATGVYYILLPWLTNGRTVGKWVVRIHLQGLNGAKISLWGLLKRYGVLYWVFFGLQVLLLEPKVVDVLSSAWYLRLQGLFLLVDLLFFIHLMIKVFKKDSMLFYESISGTIHAISWPEKIGTQTEDIPPVSVN
ncbi:teicoplanin resistance protein VanZ [Bacillus sp. FJAT-27264]|uniref:VanZ family protein n=1 Tax=Paenibacillus sp. (strain DSM 101736 / FJAT-27264) TaxID=1850362 RepID=UPI00080801C0|nr:VanZ family protein [Bacillus sp. FJAT-27264]OBZ14439.1 teicoplanin resistance protein VanZ [Bacillus sp. FJAT-27264]